MIAIELVILIIFPSEICLQNFNEKGTVVIGTNVSVNVVETQHIYALLCITLIIVALQARPFHSHTRKSIILVAITVRMMFQPLVKIGFCCVLIEFQIIIGID